jgi:hypothetical protein
MEENPDDMEKIMAETSRQNAETSAQAANLSNYNWKALGGKKIRDKSFWVLQMETMDYMVTPSGKMVDVKSKEALSTPGALPVFQLYCYDDQGIFRFTEESTGLPDSKKVLE